MTIAALCFMVVPIATLGVVGMAVAAALILFAAVAGWFV